MSEDITQDNTPSSDAPAAESAPAQSAPAAPSAPAPTQRPAYQGQQSRRPPGGPGAAPALAPPVLGPPPEHLVAIGNRRGRQDDDARPGAVLVDRFPFFPGGGGQL